MCLGLSFSILLAAQIYYIYSMAGVFNSSAQVSQQVVRNTKHSPSKGKDNLYLQKHTLKTCVGD